MRILMLTHRFPYPPVQGDSIRAWNEVAYLARRHDLWLACLDRTAPAGEHIAHVRQLCRDVVVVVRSGTACLARGGLSWAAGRSLTEGYFYDARLERVVRTWERAVEYDAVLTFSPAMSPYAGLVGGARRVLDMNDVESAKWRSYAEHSRPPLRWVYALESRRLPRAEDAWIRGHDLSLLVNECERHKLPAQLRERTTVVRTGVDLTRFPVSSPPAVPAEPVVGMLGSMSYVPNVRAVNWFGEAVWPSVRAAIPDARWLIVGRGPARSVRRWGQSPGVTVTGFVDDVRPLLAAMRVFVCPVREQIGVQTKLIEALAAGRAAVVTPQAAAGIDCDDPPPFVVAASARGLAESVIRLLRDDAQVRALAVRARRVAELRYDVTQQMSLLENVLSGRGLGEPRYAAVGRRAPGARRRRPATLTGPEVRSP